MQAWTWLDGRWLEGNPGIVGPMTHGLWLGSCVFDGARAFEGVAPDLDLHCARVVRSAEVMGLEPQLTAGEIQEIAEEGRRRFAPDAELYIRPMFWAESGLVAIDPDSTRFALVISKMPLPDPNKGFSLCLSPYRRSTPEQMPTHAKAACLYPIAGMAIADAKKRGFDNAVMRDLIGNVAELTAQNIMLVKDGVVHTPVPNGTFLNGITRQRVIGLLRDAGVTVLERTIRPEELLEADEIFSTGNHGKVVPCVRYESRTLEAGPMYRKARELYWAFAHSRSAVSARG